MAYVIHITRKNDWAGESPNITLDEFRMLKSIGELKPMDVEGYPDTYYGKLDNFYVYYAKGNINSVGPDPRLKIPDMEWINKLKKIAQILSAKVQGDDGEEY